MTSTQLEVGTWLHALSTFVAQANALELIEPKPRVDLQVTSGRTIQPAYTTAPQGLNRIAQDGESNGRLAWTPGT
jgi:hypothetical protein